jgi:hypothetical protein
MPGIPSGTTDIMVTPSLAGFTFEPSDYFIPGPLNASLDNLDFSAAPVGQTMTISGIITDLEGNSLSGITVTATGDHEQVVTTNNSGAYALSGILAGSSFRITPSSGSHYFGPPHADYINLSESLAGQNFIRLPSSNFIGGTIRREDNGSGVENVGVTATEAISQSATTNNMGFYFFSIPGGTSGSITLTPSLSGFSFSPSQRVVENYHHVHNNLVLGQDFTALTSSGPFYSRQSGAWESPDTWSRTGHSGLPANRAPEQNDQVYIRNNHKVYLTSHITNHQEITVSNGGILVTGPYRVSGNGSFSLASDGVLHIGDPAGITQSGPAGSIQTATRNFSSQGHYVYNGTLAQLTGNALPETLANLTIHNASGVTSLTSLKITSQLHLVNGLFILPAGESLAAYQVIRTGGNLRMQSTFHSGKGWRMITSPVETTYSDLLSGGFVAQGFPGSHYPDLQPNLLWFDETDIGTTNQAWRVPGSMNSLAVGGRGYFYYVFDGSGIPGGGQYHDQLPLTMTADGLEYASGTGQYHFAPTYTARSPGVSGNSEVMELNAGWNLLGNPSTASIDWDAAGGWEKHNIQNTIYIWSPGSGRYLPWNGITGSGTTKIAPFQAFWVLAEGPDPVLRMNQGAKGLGGTFAQKSQAGIMNFNREDIPVLNLEVLADTLYEQAHISFMQQGRFGEDPYDAYRLEPLSDTFLKLYTTSSMHNKPMVINNLPDELNEAVHIPLHVGGQKEGVPVTGSYTLNWHSSGIWPEHWSVTLMDHQLEKAISMKRHDTYEFNVTGGGKSIVGGKSRREKHRRREKHCRFRQWKVRGGRQPFEKQPGHIS